MTKNKIKKEYVKPILELENFAVFANIAANCEGINKVFHDFASCTVPESFLTHADDNNCGVEFGCYQVPAGETFFGS